MTTVTVCGVCQKKEAVEKCSQCGVALCGDCQKKVEKVTDGQIVLGVPTSSRKPAKQKAIVCPKCLEEKDLAYP